jgi:hypothetical protein
MGLTAAEVADISSPSRDMCVAVGVIIGGVAGMAYGAATGNWAVFLTGAIAVMIGLFQLLGGTGVLLAKLNAIRVSRANDGGGNGGGGQGEEASDV